MYHLCPACAWPSRHAFSAEELGTTLTCRNCNCKFTASNIKSTIDGCLVTVIMAIIAVFFLIGFLW